MILQGSPSGVEKTWSSAKSYCSGLSLGGSSSWRLPTISELTMVSGHLELYSYSAINGTQDYFTPGYEEVWSYTAYDTYEAWGCSFGYADCSWTDFKTEVYYARCVR
ncbi:MAG: DUF1566 domain-containing protein [SAR324 cluster bacterium]|nr:DUF1566 domain-containing protein [SAR324 cluster bacterium]